MASSIQEIFDRKNDIHRPIEKVITYGADQTDRLKAEVTEYVVTNSIEIQLERLLGNIQSAMEGGGNNEIGVWVSGFYGSGKSSFTKYLGMALDDHVEIDGQKFRKHLSDRLQKAQTRALLDAVAQKHPGTVILLDLASQQVAGASLLPVSEILYLQVLKWAGYSNNLKIFALERRFEEQGKFEEFTNKIEAEVGEEWSKLKNDPLLADAILPKIAHQIDPTWFPTEQSFNTQEGEIKRSQDEKIAQMLQIIREKSGKEHVYFVVDEVGQYVGSSNERILDLQGLAENIKRIGDGKVWLISTAQQTLTEDDDRVALNSSELFKLQNRFPITVDLEASDIREICYRRLLGKSSEGAEQLGVLFDKSGQALRSRTRLENAGAYDADFDRETFIHLYPFLPAHFDILLRLLAALAKSTGGVGLRSAIKVIQDILIGKYGENDPIAEQNVGWISTTVTFYDALEYELQRAFPNIYQAVETTKLRLHKDELGIEIAKSIAILQILGTIPVTRKNIASLMHKGVEAPECEPEITAKIEQILGDALIPIGETEGALSFQSERINDLAQERAQIVPRTADTRRILTNSIKEIFTPAPRAQVHGSLTITGGIKVLSGEQVSSLSGDSERLQFLIKFSTASDLAADTGQLVDESRHPNSDRSIYVIGRMPDGVETLLHEIARSTRIVENHRNDPDQETRDYCQAETDAASRRTSLLQKNIKKSLEEGTFIFRAASVATSVKGATIAEASRAQLSEAGEVVYDRYSEAPVRCNTNIAERFLRTANLAAMTSEIDPLSLVVETSGNHSIDGSHRAIVSVRDYIDRSGTVQGRELLDHFASDPFGWAQDTLRYIVAAMLVNTDIKITVAGRDITVAGQQAYDAFKTNNTFRSIGIAIRQDRPDNAVLSRAAERLTDLTGEDVLPLEANITKAAVKAFQKYSARLASLKTRLENMRLPGAEDVASTIKNIDELLDSDGSDAPQRIGSEGSSLIQGLEWGLKSEKALDQGLAETVKEIQNHQNQIEQLPSRGEPQALKDNTHELLETIAGWLSDKAFIDRQTDLASALTELQSEVAKSADALQKTQRELIAANIADLQLHPDWASITDEAQKNAAEDIEGCSITTTADLKGLRDLITNNHDITETYNRIRAHIAEQAREVHEKAALTEKKLQSQQGKSEDTLEREIATSSVITSKEDLNALIGELQRIRADFSYWDKIKIKIKAED